MAFLASYFLSSDFEAVLDACYLQFAKMNWNLDDRAAIYVAAATAFELSNSDDLRRSAFNRVYSNLSGYWGVFRNARGTVWTADETFDALSALGDACARGQIDLTNWQAHQGDIVLKCIETMRGIKPMGEYPHMAVAKFLHFYNPTLFPIYDRKVVWDLVCCRAFQAEWNKVCQETGIIFYETTGRFNYSYYQWAASLLAGANPALM